MEKIKEEILSVIWRHLDPEKCIVILFGSEALSSSTQRSDIDVAVDCTEGIEDETFLKLQEDLNLSVNTLRRIDLLDLSLADEEFLTFALRGAVIWHVGREYIRSWIKQRKRLRS